MFCQIVICILVLFGNRFEILGYFHKGIHLIGVEVRTFLSKMMLTAYNMTSTRFPRDCEYG